MLDALPFHVILCIADELDFQNIGKLSLVCKALAHHVQSREFWNHRTQIWNQASPGCFNDFCAEFPPDTVSPRFLYTKFMHWEYCIGHVSITIAVNWHLFAEASHADYAADLRHFSEELGIYIFIGHIISFIDKTGIWKGKLFLPGYEKGSTGEPHAKEYQNYCNQIINTIDDFIIHPILNENRVRYFTMVKKA